MSAYPFGKRVKFSTESPRKLTKRVFGTVADKPPDNKALDQQQSPFKVSVNFILTWL